jgi:hypothetical protein
MKKSSFVSCKYALAVLALAGLFASPLSIAQSNSQIATDLVELRRKEGAVAQEWFALAQKARLADELAVAEAALKTAEDLGFSPVAVGLEEARILIGKGGFAAAVAKMRALFDSGFTSVSALTADPVINSLSGRADFDKLIADMSVQAYPCEHYDGFRDFDFWIGKWDVHVANGTYVGSNVIERDQRGCVLIENWTNASGGTGMSVNYLDMSNNEWVQVWNAEGGSQINIRGKLTDEGMLMVGKLHNVATGTTVPFRALFTPLPDGRVRQFFEQSNDGGNTWVVWFEGFYSRTDREIN